MSSPGVDIGTLIVRTLGGRPRIDGTRIGVDTIAINVFRHGVAPEVLASDEYWPYISLAQVYAALAYYHAHKEQIDAEIDEDKRLYREQAAEAKRSGQGVIPGR